MRGATRLKRSLQRLSAETARRTGLPVRIPRLLSVVIAAPAGAPLGECLDSLRRQDLDAVEVVVVAVGAAAAQDTRGVGGADPRFRVVVGPDRLAAARNAGADAAVGEYITFLDADDAVAPHGLAMAVATLRDSEADLVVLGHRPFRRGQLLPMADRIRALHALRRDGATLESFPDALADTVTGARVFRRRWYDAAGLRFDESLAACDHAHSVAAYVAARSVTLLPHVGLLRRVDLDRTPLTRLAPDTAGLTEWARGVDAAMGLLPPGLAAVAAAEALAGPLVPFTDRAWRCADDYWATLRDVVRRLRSSAADELRGRVPAYQKVLTRLVADGDRDAVRRLLTEVRPTPHRYPTQVAEVDGRPGVVVDLGPAWTDVAPSERVLGDVEAGVRAQLTELRDLGGGRLSLHGWAYLDNVDLADREASLGLVARSGETTVPIAVSREACADADVASDLSYADVTTSGFVAELDLYTLRGGTGLWSLEAAVSVEGLAAAGPVHVSPWTMAGVPSWYDASGRGWHLDHDDAHRVELRSRADPWPGLTVETDDRALRLRFPAGSVRAVSLEAPGCPAIEVALTGETAEVAWTEVGVRRKVIAVDRSGTAREVLAPPGAFGDPRVRATRRGGLSVAPAAVEAVAVELRADALVVRLRAAGLSVVDVALTEGQTVVPGELSVVDEGLLDAVLPLSRTHWGVAGLPLPSGRYAVSVRAAGGDWVAACPAAELCRTLPVEQLGPDLRARVEAFRPDDPALRLVVEPPLADDERGQRHQRLMREAARVEVADRDAVFFRAMFSEYANGNGLGVHKELVRRGSCLELLWSVLDRSVAVPPGGTGVVERSRAWHEAVARSRYHVVDVHQLEWFVRPEGQVLIQTFHGYPYKVMGHQWWEKMGNPVQEIGSLDRRTREWSALVSPAPYATPLLRAAFLEPAGADDVPVLELGYPRNDVLLGPEAAELRASTRRLLGLDDDAVAVLYAPTFRDYLSAEDRTARRVDFLDVARALELLPSHYVVLVRGHAFNARIRTERLGPRDRVVDVTDHPDVNHLILASDVAVLDYSSLRFDYVLSGNSMVFLVPDLEAYDGARGGVIPYGPTAPGPLVTTTADAVRWLADLPRLSAAYAQARRTFRATYVPLEDGHSAARLVDALIADRAAVDAGER